MDLSSRLFKISLCFYNRREIWHDEHIGKQKSGAENPFSRFTADSNKKINLRDMINTSLKHNECKRFGLSSEDYKRLMSVKIWFQHIFDGYSTVTCYHWSVFSGMSVFVAVLDYDYVKNEAIYCSPDRINGAVSFNVNDMIRKNLTSYEDNEVKITRYFAEAVDYPLDETQKEYADFMKKARTGFLNAYSPYFSSFDGNIQGKSVCISTSFANDSTEYKKLKNDFSSIGAIVKDNIGKNTNILLVDTENIEKLGCFLERNWRLAQGDSKEASKIPHPMIDRAISYNDKGSDIKIVSMQEALEFFNK